MKNISLYKTILPTPIYSFLRMIKRKWYAFVRRNGGKDWTDKIIMERDRISSEEHLSKITHKGDFVYSEKGFRVFNGHHNIFLGSNIYLVDSLLNAGDTVGKITIDDYVFFGTNVSILARAHNYNVFNLDRHQQITEKPIHIKEGAWIASGAIVLGGVTIGKHSVVGAGAVVASDVEDYAIVAGNPAKFIRFIEHK